MMCNNFKLTNRLYKVMYIISRLRIILYNRYHKNMSLMYFYSILNMLSNYYFILCMFNKLINISCIIIGFHSSHLYTYIMAILHLHQYMRNIQLLNRFNISLDIIDMNYSHQDNIYRCNHNNE